MLEFCCRFLKRVLGDRIPSLETMRSWMTFQYTFQDPSFVLAQSSISFSERMRDLSDDLKFMQQGSRTSQERFWRSSLSRGRKMSRFESPVGRT